MLLSALLEDFMLYQRAANRSPRTIAWYREYVGRFEAFLVRHGYSCDCHEITSKIIREYLLEIQERYKPHTVSNSIRTLKALFNYAVKEELLDVDPTRRIPTPKIPQTDYVVHDVEEIDQLLKACNLKTLTGVRDFAIVMLLFDSGIRAGELLGLRDRDIDWDRGLITVNGKGSKQRAVPVSAKTLRAIRRYVGRRDSGSFHDGEALFVGHSGAALTHSGLGLLMRRLRKRTGLHVHPHKFRHSFAVNALRNDAREFDIQDCLGHTTLMMTKHYARQAATDLAEQHKRFSPVQRLRTRV